MWRHITGGTLAGRGTSLARGAASLASLKTGVAVAVGVGL